MSTPLLVQALAALSAPALVGATVLGLRVRRERTEAAEDRERLNGRIAELEERCAELERTASCDSLTGVWNYRHLQLTLDREIERARRAEHTGQADGPRPLAVLLLEIAGFDAVIAEHGRARGNAILRDLAQRLAMEIRRADTLGRYSGEEFLVVLPDTGSEGAVQVAERLVWSVRRHLLLDWSSGTRAPRPVGGNGLTAAVGIAVLPEDGTHAAVLLRSADAALATARAAGGDCWRIAPRPGQPSGGPREQPPSAPQRPSTAERDRSGKAGSLSACTGRDPLAQPVTAHPPATAAVPRDVLS
ncbi:GGDEF domain-containing protein [Kitasatospora cathayae]|uniref:GGDEF domain-containing protein n=1 Tax=Kitasatospora cathayae TaxID=3004092 RepID=A0ABY7Q3T9_9ACTN|nr:GGDEF domain-containing protein [Kitasatospora sp. HUAS 3-15]WBP87332.1 GGDEF domain-containing protein [Kitasatospora sp. HUAS 3-15]